MQAEEAERLAVEAAEKLALEQASTDPNVWAIRTMINGTLGAGGWGCSKRRGLQLRQESASLQGLVCCHVLAPACTARSPAAACATSHMCAAEGRSSKSVAEALGDLAVKGPAARMRVLYEVRGRFFALCRACTRETARLVEAVWAYEGAPLASNMLLPFPPSLPCLPSRRCLPRRPPLASSHPWWWSARSTSRRWPR